MDVFQEEITFQKMGQASQADIFFDVGHLQGIVHILLLQIVINGRRSVSVVLNLRVTLLVISTAMLKLISKEKSQLLLG